MPVIKKALPDGSTEIINSPSVLVKNPKTGKMERAKSTRTIIPPQSNEPSVQTSSIKALPKGNDRGLVTPAPRIFESSQGPINQDFVTGNIALLGTLLGKAWQFVSRSGTEGKSEEKKHLRVRSQEELSSDSLLSPEMQKIINATPAELNEMSGLNKTKESDFIKLEGVQEVRQKMKKSRGTNLEGSKDQNSRKIKKMKKKIKKWGREL